MVVVRFGGDDDGGELLPVAGSFKMVRGLGRKRWHIIMIQKAINQDQQLTGRVAFQWGGGRDAEWGG